MAVLVLVIMIITDLVGCAGPGDNDDNRSCIFEERAPLTYFLRLVIMRGL
jgi:hypothetical protein